MGSSKYKTSAVDTVYHIYNRGNHKREIFIEDKDFIIYLRKLQELLPKHNYSLIAYCLMPNHIHLLVKQNSEITPSKLIASLHTSYVRIFNKKYDKVGHLFQGRFKQKIVAMDEYAQYLIGYIHLNPVKSGLCKNPQDYPWSSYKEYTESSTMKLCDNQLIEQYGLGSDPTTTITIMKAISNMDLIF